MKHPVFSFVPERYIGKEVTESYRVSIFKQNVLCFPRSIVDIYELEGKYVRLFADVEKKVIG